MCVAGLQTSALLSSVGTAGTRDRPDEHSNNRLSGHLSITAEGCAASASASNLRPAAGSVTSGANTVARLSISCHQKQLDHYQKVRLLMSVSDA
jgi:hypothetical protein